MLSSTLEELIFLQCYTSKLDECQNDARKVWNVIRSMLPYSKPIKETPDLLVTDRGTISDYQNIANKFSNCFCSIGSNLANNFLNTFFKSFSTFLNKRVSSSIYLNIPNPKEIFNVIYSLKKKTVGYDDIPGFFLQIAFSVTIPYLAIEGIFKCFLMPVPSSDEWGRLRQEGHPMKIFCHVIQMRYVDKSIPDRSRPGLPMIALGVVRQGTCRNYATSGLSENKSRKRGRMRVRMQREIWKGRRILIRVGTLKIGTTTELEESWQT